MDGVQRRQRAARRSRSQTDTGGQVAETGGTYKTTLGQ